MDDLILKQQENSEIFVARVPPWRVKSLRSLASITGKNAKSCRNLEIFHFSRDFTTTSIFLWEPKIRCGAQRIDHFLVLLTKPHHLIRCAPHQLRWVVAYVTKGEAQWNSSSCMRFSNLNLYNSAISCATPLHQFNWLVIVQLIIPDEQPCFDLTQMSTLISQLCPGLFSSISLLFAWRAVCVEFISCSPLNN